MLHQETVEPFTLELIRDLQHEEALSGFNLVGGTALALQIGHRISDDIDLFTQQSFDAEKLAEYLEQKYDMAILYIQKNTLKGIIGHVQVDILSHQYRNINQSIESDGIVLLSKPDIAAMKVNAIAGNGTRIKDFVDIYFLLKEYTFAELVDFYRIKYQQRNDFHAVKSLTFFEDIDEASWPRMILEKDLSLEKIESSILYNQQKYLDDAKDASQ